MDPNILGFLYFIFFYKKKLRYPKLDSGHTSIEEKNMDFHLVKLLAKERIEMIIAGSCETRLSPAMIAGWALLRSRGSGECFTFGTQIPMDLIRVRFH